MTTKPTDDTTDDEYRVPESPHDFETNPNAPEVETTFATYDCGGSVLAPVDEVENAPETCPVCGAERVDR